MYSLTVVNFANMCCHQLVTTKTHVYVLLIQKQYSITCPTRNIQKTNLQIKKMNILKRKRSPKHFQNIGRFI